MILVLILPNGVKAAAAGTASDAGNGLKYIGAALSTGLATIGTGYAVGQVGSAALGAISEDASILGRTIIFEESLTLENAKDKISLAKDFIDNKGFGVDPLNDLLSKFIDEKKVRESKMEFGLNTVDVENRKVLNLFIDDIPQGHLRDYLRASSNLLVFKQEKIDGKRLIDGGYMENNPYKMIDDVCDEIVLVSLKPYLLTNKLKRNPKYTIIKTWDRGFPKIYSSTDRKSTRLNSSHVRTSRMPSSA